MFRIPVKVTRREWVELDTLPTDGATLDHDVEVAFNAQNDPTKGAVLHFDTDWGMLAELLKEGSK